MITTYKDLADGAERERDVARARVHSAKHSHSAVDLRGAARDEHYPTSQPGHSAQRVAPNSRREPLGPRVLRQYSCNHTT